MSESRTEEVDLELRLYEETRRREVRTDAYLGGGAVSLLLLGLLLIASSGAFVETTWCTQKLSVWTCTSSNTPLDTQAWMGLILFGSAAVLTVIVRARPSRCREHLARAIHLAGGGV